MDEPTSVKIFTAMGIKNWWYLFDTELNALTEFFIFFLVLQKQVQTLPVDHGNNSQDGG